MHKNAWRGNQQANLPQGSMSEREKSTNVCIENGQKAEETYIYIYSPMQKVIIRGKERVRAGRERERMGERKMERGKEKERDRA